MKAKHIIQKSFETIPPHAGIDSIEKRLRDHSFLVVADDSSFFGILTPPDIIESPHQRVIDCLNHKPRAGFEQDLQSVLILMNESGNSVLPVFHGDEFIGVVTQQAITDYLVEFRDELKRAISEPTAKLAKANEELEQETQERKRVREMLEAERKRLLALLDGVPAYIYLQAPDHSIRFANRCFRERFGEPQARRCYEVIARRDKPCNSCRPFRVFHTNEPIEWEWTARDGRKYQIYDYPFSDIDGSPLVLELGMDITERTRLEAKVRQAQKMDAIGTIARGIAHDFNNLLTGILGNASLMLLGVTSSHKDYERLKNIEQYVERGVELTKQLLGFSSVGGYEVKPTDLNELVEKTSMSFGRTRNETRIHRKYLKDIWTVEVDRGRIEQALLSLYANACRATSESGELYLQTENVTLDETDVAPDDLTPGHYVKLSAVNTGCAVKEKTTESIFDPLFAISRTGTHTDLRLTYAYDIIRNHGGIVNIYGKKGEASAFSLYLPASQKAVSREKRRPDEVLKGTETVLLVDDDDAILDVGKEILKEMGHKVLLASGGKQAVEVYKKNKDMIDLIILDIVMPDMGGGEVYDTLKAINPNTKVLLSSGYSSGDAATEIMERGCDGFIQKPFTMRQLSGKIRRILDKE